MSSDPVKADNDIILDTITSSIHISSVKQLMPLEKMASPVSLVGMAQMEERRVTTPKEFSAIVPNLHIPDYGSAMTSSIYLRGFGSRIDNPVIGLYIDDIPVMNKNSYDFDMADISSAAFLRGPQATIYGRNSMCGVLTMNTLSPQDYQGVRAAVEYGSANTVSLRAAAYGFSGMSLSLNYKHSDGFYTNYHDGSMADRYDAGGLRFRVYRKFRPDLVFENILSASMLGQKGFPYQEYDHAADTLKQISYNDPSRYRRLNVTEGVKIKYMAPQFSLNSVTSVQFLSDKMTLDQDFTERSMFTLIQSQNEVSVTQELILRPEISWRTPWWNWQTGFFGFFKHNAMSAPVRFKKDGIRDLIVSNANEGMQAGLPGAQFYIKEDEFDIFSDFGLTTYGLALYHESVFTLGRWVLTAGLRVDYENSAMNYDSNALVNYRLDAPGLSPMPRYIPYQCTYAGQEHNQYLEFMPRFSFLYDAGPVELFASFSSGYKAGGFNVQIFSDILQNKMMEGIMSDMGVYFDNPAGGVGAENTSYKPEHSLDAEVGMRFSKKFSSGHSLSFSATGYHTLCNNQQITVFPEGKNTGRMMANVGRSRSVGAEAEIAYSLKGFSLLASYGYCNAVFVEYDDGKNDFSGKRIPYSPENTASVRLSYTWDIGNVMFKSISAAIDFTGAGRIWWNEDNSLSQPFYCILGADVRGHFRTFDVFLRGSNLIDTDYRTFYFKSVGNSFFQTGKPLRFDIGIAFNL